MLRSPSRTGKCLPLPSAFGKTLTSGAAFSSFPACSCFQGNKIPQARAEVSHLNVTQANNQSCSALPTARRSQPSCLRRCKGDVGAHAPRRDAPITGTPVNHWEQRPIPGMRCGRWAALGSAPGRSVGVQGAGGRFWGSSNLPLSSNLAKPPCFRHQGLSGGSLVGGVERALPWQGPALALPLLLPVLLPGITAPGKVAKGRRLEP